MAIKNSLYRLLGTKMIYKNLPFLYFLCGLGVIYIWNVHEAERNIRKAQTLQTELREEKWRYMTIQSDLMYQSTPTMIERSVAEQDLHFLTKNPVVIR
ncbi:MAG: FtsL-like putative cell division protein [Saprospiraceae bacterium]